MVYFEKNTSTLNWLLMDRRKKKALIINYNISKTGNEDQLHQAGGSGRKISVSSGFSPHDVNFQAS